MNIPQDFTGGVDPIYENFLEQQREEGMVLSRSSDLLDLHIAPAAPPHFVAEFRCTGLRRNGSGDIQEANEFAVGIWFPSDYLRRADTFEMLRVFTSGLWHPNVSAELPLICVGRLAPGTPLVDILYQIYDMLTYQKFNPRENDALNKAACAWARQNQHRFPIDRRPLKRARLDLEVKPI
jgi:ubiquitin-protein ligase